MCQEMEPLWKLNEIRWVQGGVVIRLHLDQIFILIHVKLWIWTSFINKIDIIKKENPHIQLNQVEHKKKNQRKLST